MTRTQTVAAALALLLTGARALMPSSPTLPPLTDCGRRGFSWSWQQGHCIGNLEDDRR
jgi:hypothetical protein